MNRFLFAMIVLFAAPVLAADSSDIPASPIVKAELVVDAARVKQGQTVWAGVTFTMPEHWHIYWQNPGDSGIPTTMAWTLPPGLAAGEIVWPVPERLEVSGLVNYGYSGRVTLPVPLTASADVAGPVSVTVKWLVCKDICIPESAVLTAVLPVQTQAATATLNSARAAAPQQTLRATYQAQNERVQFRVPLDGAAPKRLQFFPLDDGIVANHATQALSDITVDDAAHTVSFALARGSAEPGNPLRGVLVTGSAQGEARYLLEAVPDAVGGPEPAAPVASLPPAPVVSLAATLLLAFLGGLILNIMPCVLPILALKALAVAKKADVSRRAAARQGLAYSAGVIGSFLAIAGLMLALKSAGESVGWGFQLQQPVFVAIMAAVMLLVALNLLGLFTLPVLFGARATGVDESTVRGSLFTGMLAVLVATPCTAPFMATAIGATLALPPTLSLLVFAALGAGMAAPFLLISVWPAARRLLPKPGKWMHRFKQLLAIPMLATALWLGWVLWQLQHPGGPMAAAHEVFSDARLSELVAEGKPVLVDATADWCLTCKVNERVALSPAPMQDFLAEHSVVLMVADWTANDPEITRYLAKFGRAGVPLYVYYPPGGAPVVLPQLLTPAIVRGAIIGASEK